MPQFAKLAGDAKVVPQKPMKLTSVGLDELLKPPRIDSRIKTPPSHRQNLLFRPQNSAQIYRQETSQVETVRIER